MVIRKRHQPTPHFKLPAPFQPMTSERAQLLVPGIFPYCAMMQIAAEDTHCNYVVCRGYDPRDKRYYDYDEEDQDGQPGIAVAKPYWNRFTGVYQIGEVYPAFLSLSAGAKDGDKTVPFIGQNPGRVKGDECQGHPPSLDEEIVHLLDEDEKYINWMLADGGAGLIPYCTRDSHPGEGIVFRAYAPGVWDPSDHDWVFTCDDDHTYKIIDRDYGVPEPGAGARGFAVWQRSDDFEQILLVVTMDCDTRGTCAGCS